MFSFENVSTDTSFINCVFLQLSPFGAPATNDLPREVFPILFEAVAIACTVSPMRAVSSVIIVTSHLSVQCRVEIAKSLNFDTQFLQLKLIISISNFHKVFMTL